MSIIHDLLGRQDSIFQPDYSHYYDELTAIATRSSFLVVGGAGTIGAAVVRELVHLGAKKIDVVDISENNLVELVRDIRSSTLAITTDLQTYAIDAGSLEFRAFFARQPAFDYVLNLSAMKHVRSERDAFTLSRLVDVNITNSVELLRLADQAGSRKFFCVSTDKAANPVNMMGASKSLMEQFIFAEPTSPMVSTARFANVAFSDGSLLAGFDNRLAKGQPLAVPTDIKRYFVTPQESGQLCVLSCMIGKDKEILFPKNSDRFRDISLVQIAKRYLQLKGFGIRACETEAEAVKLAAGPAQKNEWPCYFFESDTTGEKAFEEFYSDGELLDLDAFQNIGGVRYRNTSGSRTSYDDFQNKLAAWRQSGRWDKTELVLIFKEYLPRFEHKEKNKNLDQKM